MKAWLCFDGTSAVVVYAETCEKARYKGLKELDCDYYIDVKARRAAVLDGEPHEASTREFYLAGGAVECDKCSRIIEAKVDVEEVGQCQLRHVFCPVSSVAFMRRMRRIY